MSDEIAREDELPAILRDLPWRRPQPPPPPALVSGKRKPKKREPKLPALDLEIPDTPLGLHWSERARRRWVAGRFRGLETLHEDAAIEAVRADIEAGKDVPIQSGYPADFLLPLLANPPGNVTIWHTTSEQSLALFGEEALAIVVENYPNYLSGEVRMRVESPHIAVALADQQLVRIADVGEAFRWIERYPVAAMRGLIACVWSDDERLRIGAARGLRHLASKGHAAEIEDYAQPLMPAEHHDALHAILTRDPEPLKKTPATPPAMPDPYPDKIRPPRLLNGRPFSLDAMRRFDELLAAYANDPTFYRFKEIRDACDPLSLALHAWDLAQAWYAGRQLAGQRWMLLSVLHFGNDDVVRRLPPARLCTIVPPILGRIGTDGALMDLVTIRCAMKTWKAFAAHKQANRIDDIIERISQVRGVDVDVLLDDLIPIRPISANGIALDLGDGRIWRVAFDAQLKPVYFDETGLSRKLLPQKLDPIRRKAIKALLAYLDEDVQAILDVRVTALERAMVDGRTWQLDTFRRVWVDHRLMHVMVRGALWEAHMADGSAIAFRIAEDGSFADSDDKPLSTKENLSKMIGVGVAHPMRLSHEMRGRWRTTFAEYEILQPFEQLGREPPQLSEAELDATVIERSSRTQVYGRFRLPPPLERAGFLNVEWGRSVLPFGPGSGNAYGAIERQGQKFSASVFLNRRRARFRDVDDVVRCEMMRALEILCAGDS